MNIFLDSSSLINKIRSKEHFDSNNNYLINPIVYTEVLYGVLYLKKTEKSLGEFLAKNNVGMVKVGKKTASIYTKAKLDLNKKGTPIADNDLLIAASCLEYGLTLETLNLKHFKRVPKLKIK